MNKYDTRAMELVQDYVGCTIKCDIIKKIMTIYQPDLIYKIVDRNIFGGFIYG